ncbi:dihydrofolate reductase [Fructobacillus sp. M2-14]|uniref:Dihydrofolate reductase n=1 Tax=Fructobacillus broussonetiae TaxID=2713173 RepID=A0ABS5QYG8_9LACO|nr:dihydrofolate reductase [Fructobacillus broussonetiae]MBS9338229.1 dihydrofolate reductase [Fructobacillus broussonetiae]
MKTVRMVWAEDDKHAIGKDGSLPWRLPKDLAHFKKETVNSTMVMGRATWESIGRPLPKRKTVVLTSQLDFNPGYDDVTVVHSLTELQNLIDAELTSERLVTVAGGATLYKALMPVATELSVTKVEGDFDGDTFVEPVNTNLFELVSEEKDEDEGQAIKFLLYKRKPLGGSHDEG